MPVRTSKVEREWTRHIKGAAAKSYGPGLRAPGEGGNLEEWHYMLYAHKKREPDCPICGAAPRRRRASAPNQKTKASSLVRAIVDLNIQRRIAGLDDKLSAMAKIAIGHLVP